MAFGKTKQLLLLSAIWIILVFLVSFLGGSAFRGNDLSLLAILVVLNAAVTFTVAYMQLRVLQKCAIRVPGSSAWIARIRGSNYALSKQKSAKEIDDDRTCVLSGWGVGHILMYAAIAAVVPRRWKELFLIGLLWELIEYPFGVSYALDLIYNGIGIAIGVGVRCALAKGV